MKYFLYFLDSTDFFYILNVNLTGPDLNFVNLRGPDLNFEFVTSSMHLELTAGNTCPLF